MEDDLRWKMTFDGRRSLMEDNVPLKTIPILILIPIPIPIPILIPILKPILIPIPILIIIPKVRVLLEN